MRYLLFLMIFCACSKKCETLVTPTKVFTELEKVQQLFKGNWQEGNVTCPVCDNITFEDSIGYSNYQTRY